MIADQNITILVALPNREVGIFDDGVNWTQATATAGWSARRYHTSVVFDGKMWVIGGYSTATLRDVWYLEKQLLILTVSTDDSIGLIVGASDSAFSATATALTAKIAHGTGAGQLEYSVMPYATDTVEPATNGSKTTMTLARRFENSSGGSVTIKEVGIMSVSGLLCRIIPATPIVIENGASEVISIVFETEV